MSPGKQTGCWEAALWLKPSRPVSLPDLSLLTPDPNGDRVGSSLEGAPGRSQLLPLEMPAHVRGGDMEEPRHIWGEIHSSLQN